MKITQLWTMRDLNPRPPACEADILPAELIARYAFIVAVILPLSRGFYKKIKFVNQHEHMFKTLWFRKLNVFRR